MKNSDSEILKFNLSELSWNEVCEEKDVTRGFPCYDDMCFEGEVTGKELGITYGPVIHKTNRKGIPMGIPEDPIIKTLYGQELSKGGIWLKFTDYKESVKQANNGKPYTFYVSKKPILKRISWYDLEELGMVYAPDVVDSNGPKPGIVVKNSNLDYSYGIRESYSPALIEGNNQKYQISLMRGLSNYGDMNGINSPLNTSDTKHSQWNRPIAAITTSYRGYCSYLEHELILDCNNKEFNPYICELEVDLKNKTGDYNWFGDLNIGSGNDFEYNNKYIEYSVSQGQRNWMQEYQETVYYRSCRGDMDTSGGSSENPFGSPIVKEGCYGFRPVLSPID